MIVRTETKESCIKLAHQYDSDDSYVVIVCRHTVDKHWLEEALTDSGLDLVELLVRGEPKDDELLEDILNPDPRFEDKGRVDVLLIVDEGPAIVRTIPVA